ncbi:GPO family capsid scaffolding protein [Burkholderia gladioli]|uniref:GPO family capsid scaffolding protein n=1 Tax=Burkholderia gladioli TaxID=28095 RepID=UPI001FC7F9C6|nr:GPO family capsid scaffolding protein [Burkholderia gladioli]
MAAAAMAWAGTVVCLMPAHAYAADLVVHALHIGDVMAAISGKGAAIGGAGVAALAFGIGSTSDAPASKWFRVAVEGATTDGRTIERDWIEQMAQTYDPKVYGARVNCEHVRGLSPMAGTNPNPFGSFGDVVALKAAEVTDDGPLKGKLGLYAKVQPNKALIALTEADQKIYTSIEVAPSFADTKQAYMIGLAVTDSPASLGTEVLKFAAGQGENNMFAGRKQHRDNLFTAAELTTIEFEAAPATEGMFRKVKELLGLVEKRGESTDKRFADVGAAVELLATAEKGNADMIAKLTAELAETRQAQTKTETELKELIEKLSKQPNGPSRALSTGGNGSAAQTDC